MTQPYIADRLNTTRQVHEVHIASCRQHIHRLVSGVCESNCRAFLSCFHFEPSEMEDDASLALLIQMIRSLDHGNWFAIGFVIHLFGLLIRSSKGIGHFGSSWAAASWPVLFLVDRFDCIISSSNLSNWDGVFRPISSAASTRYTVFAECGHMWPCPLHPYVCCLHSRFVPNPTFLHGYGQTSATRPPMLVILGPRS